MTEWLCRWPTSCLPGVLLVRFLGQSLVELTITAGSDIFEPVGFPVLLFVLLSQIFGTIMDLASLIYLAALAHAMSAATAGI